MPKRQQSQRMSELKCDNPVNEIILEPFMTNKSITNLLQIRKLNPHNDQITSPLVLNILNNDKGQSVFLNSTENIQLVAVLEFLPGATIRGNHFHKQKVENLYIIEGKLKLYCWLPDQPEIEEHILEAGHLITIQPNLAHAYEAIERTLALETGSRSYDPADTIVNLRR